MQCFALSYIRKRDKTLKGHWKEHENTITNGPSRLKLLPVSFRYYFGYHKKFYGNQNSDSHVEYLEWSHSEKILYFRLNKYLPEVVSETAPPGMRRPFVDLKIIS